MQNNREFMQNTREVFIGSDDKRIFSCVPVRLAMSFADYKEENSIIILPFLGCAESA